MAAAHWSLAPDPWLATVLERDVYRLVLNDTETPGHFDDPAVLARTLASRPGFSYAKVSTRNLAAVRFLLAAGFRLVDTNVVLDKPVKRFLRNEAGVRFATPDDRAGLRRIAREAFEFSRFHLDPDIPGELAGRIKEEWVESYLSHRRGDALVTKTVDGAAVGFLALLADPADGTLVIDLIAVDARHRGRGIAAAMIRFGESGFPSAPRTRVGTQLTNLPSLRLYQKLGFRVADSRHVFHHHSVAS